MKHLISALIITTLFSATVFSQNKYFLNGVIGIQGGELYSYDMELSATSNPNEFKGTVKTYALIDKEVTAEVTLTVDRNKKTARLVESKILYNKGFQSNATICLVDAALTYESQNGILKGPIITQTSGDGAYCAIGNVTFTSTNEINRLFNIEKISDPIPPVPNTEPKSKPVSPSPSSQPPVRTQQPHPVAQNNTSVKVDVSEKTIKEVTQGKDAEIIWHSDKIIMHIWDDNKIDGDRVSVLYNGKEILTNYQITSAPKVLELETNGSELNIITIIAMSEGSEPPNTAMIRLFDSESVSHDILSHNNAGKKSYIRIRRKI